MLSQRLSMKPAYSLSVPLAGFFIALGLLVGSVQSEDPACADEAQEETKKLNDFIESSVDWYEVLPDVGRVAGRPIATNESDCQSDSVATGTFGAGGFVAGQRRTLVRDWFQGFGKHRNRL